MLGREQFEMSDVKYDDLEVKFETKETPESHLLLVHIPEGFERHNIGAKVEFDYGRVRVYGELPPEKNKIKRFNQLYQVPATCDISNIRGKLDGRIVTITMRKKKISKIPTDQKPEPIPAQEAPKTSEQETRPEPEAKPEPVPAQEAPKTSEQETRPETEQDNKDHYDDTPTQPQPDEEEDQKGQKNKYQEKEHTSDKEEDQKGSQEGFSNTRAEYNKEEADTKTPTQPEDKEEYKNEMDQKGVTEEATSNEEKPEPIREEESEEVNDGEKTIETEKKHDEETLVQKSLSIVNNNKRKISSALAPYVPEVTAKRMTTILEDKQKLVYMGAAFAVVALGVYVSYKLRSSDRH